MALFHSHFFSETLSMQCQAEVILPQATSSGNIGQQTVAERKQWPCVWLLHGYSDDHTIWTRRTSIERYAEERGLAVIMPNAHKSFYTDMAHGDAYFTFLTQELPRIMRSFFPLSPRPGDNAVAGLSMGGYGAFKWILNHPQDFLAGVSLSGSLNLGERLKELMHPDSESQSLRRMAHVVFDDQPPSEAPDNLLALLEARAEDGTCPPLRMCCGMDDFLYVDNQEFLQKARELRLSIDYREGPGEHNWGYWDAQLESSLDWLLEQGLGARAAPQ